MQNARQSLSFPVILALAGFAYIVATAVTTWVFIGDAPHYAWSVMGQFSGGDCHFFEFGHLLWRPTGYAMTAIANVGSSVESSRETWLQIQSLLALFSWVAGLVTVLAGAAWLFNVTRSGAATLAGAAFIIVTKSFLNFSQTGTSYVPALCFLTLALWLGSGERKDSKTAYLMAVATGFALAFGMLYWAPAVFVAPAVLIAPLVFTKAWKTKFSPVVVSGLTCCVCMIGTYAFVGWLLNFQGLADYRAWIADPQNGVTIGGPARTIIGLARFVVDLGGLGPLAKRYMIPDQFNPVAAAELINFDLFKLMALWMFAGLCVVLAWFATEGRRTLLFFALGCGPLVGFALFWQGGDLERYLPALPVFALLVAQAYAGGLRWAPMRRVVPACIAMIALVNLAAMWSGKVRGAQDAEFARVGMLPSEFQPTDLVVVSHSHDPLIAAATNNPWHERAETQMYSLLMTEGPDAPKWREKFASTVLSSWNRQQNVWVSTRVLAAKPNVEWGWIEGDDDRLSWNDFPAYFKKLQYATSVPADADGFMLVADSPANREALGTFMGAEDAAKAPAARAGKGPFLACQP